MQDDRAAAALPGTSRFHVDQPTRVVAGAGAADEVGRYAASYGRRALVVAGGQHARASGLLARVEASLRSEGVATELLEGVGANPTASLVDAGAMLARVWRADVVVGVGAGSVMDAAKAIATSAAAAETRPFREHLSGLRPAGLLVAAALPVVGVPTLPGSGSETNGTSVITDDITGRKLSAHSDLVAPRVALLDPELALGAPAELLAPGLVDAWCHALEAGLSASATIASDAYAEQALRALQREGAAPIKAADRDERSDALLRAWWATNLAGLALTHAGSIVTHPLAHPLSARLDARHGCAVAALEPAVLATFADRFEGSGAAVRVCGWLGVRPGREAQGAVRGILTRFARYRKLLGVRAGAAELGVSEQLCGDIVRDARQSGSRGLANVPGGEPSADSLFAVLDLALTHASTDSPQELLDAAAAARASWAAETVS